ncbi:glutaredoxin family protein [Sphaerotilus sp.]|uniref:glutaredoxin family protein n=1 Tax=Sphaerotilus sp. TaxID=2093942 RepID=UPI0025EAB6DB|nr:glutaredoxin family protein [Sphaerotilus sp.]
MTSQATRCSSLAGALLLLVLAGGAAAQYKVVGPDGRVTYTDRPAAGAGTTAAARPLGSTDPSTSEVELPYVLRQVVARYPATLYTTQHCGPCDSARALLQQRGVPVRERTLDRAEDVAELQRREGLVTLPLLRLGAQRLQGFEPGDWQATLDAAGYPRTSQLPPHWRAAPAQPLAPPDTSPQADASPVRPAAPVPAPVLPGASGRFRF